MTINVRGAEVYYEQQGAGAPLLLLHGWGGSVESWIPVVRDFSKERQVTVIEFPGHNRSPEPPEPWSVTEYADMTAQLITALGIEGTDIIAHSFGGRVSILLAATHPALVGRLILTASAGLIPKDNAGSSKKKSRYQHLRALADNAFTRTLLGEDNVEKMRNSLRQKYGSADYKALKTDRMRATFNRVIAQDLEQQLPKIKASTLLIYGDQDTATPLWMGQTMERLIPDAGLVTMPGAGHFAYLERYDQFKAIAMNFLHI